MDRFESPPGLDERPALNTDWLGGSPKLFERAGREQLIVLLEHGLTSESRVLDVGCGALRGGRWIIPLLEPGHYYGIEPNRAMVERGLRDFIPLELTEMKRPNFDYKDSFDFSVFSTSFTHVMARSIWTHASKTQIKTMLDGFVACSEPGSVFLASFVPVSRLGSLPRPLRAVPYRLGFRSKGDYKGEAWVGRSPEDTQKAVIAHKFSWIRSECGSRGLSASLLPRPGFGAHQIWAVVKRPDGPLP